MTLIIREMQSRPQRDPILCLLSKRQDTSAGSDVEKRQPLCTLGGEYNWCRHLWRTACEVPSKNNKTKLRISYMIYNSTQGIYLKKKRKTLIRKDIHTPMFAATIIIAQVRKRRCRHLPKIHIPNLTSLAHIQDNSA